MSTGWLIAHADCSALQSQFWVEEFVVFYDAEVTVEPLLSQLRTGVLPHYSACRMIVVAIQIMAAFSSIIFPLIFDLSVST